MHLPAVMAQPTEQSEKIPVVQKLPLNERILSSMTRKNDAAHPWHDLEIGMCLLLRSYVIYIMTQKPCNVVANLSAQDLEHPRSSTVYVYYIYIFFLHFHILVTILN